MYHKANLPAGYEILRTQVGEYLLLIYDDEQDIYRITGRYNWRKLASEAAFRHYHANHQHDGYGHGEDDQKQERHSDAESITTPHRA